MNVLEQRQQRLHAFRRGGEDDRVARLQRVDGVVDRRCQRVGRGHDGGDHAFGPVIDRQAVLVVILDMAEGGDVLDIAHQAEGLVVVLANLVVGIAEAGFLDSHLGKRAVALRLHQNPGDRLARLVKQGLRAHCLVTRLRGAGAGDNFVNHHCVFGHGTSFPASWPSQPASLGDEKALYTPAASVNVPAMIRIVQIGREK